MMGGFCRKACNIWLAINAKAQLANLLSVVMSSTRRTAEKNVGQTNSAEL
jgi:hypothetical protein